MLQHAGSNEFVQVHIKEIFDQHYAMVVFKIFNYYWYFGCNVMAIESILAFKNYGVFCKYNEDFDGEGLCFMIKNES